MNHEQFVVRVRERGGYADTGEARRITFVVLFLLGQRLGQQEATRLATQLPRGIGEAVAARGIGDVVSRGSWTAGVDEFLRAVAEEVTTTPQGARWDANAVLGTVTEAAAGRQLMRVLSRLQPSYAHLFAPGDPRSGGPGHARRATSTNRYQRE
jgi:uncharacterized protein (DUF2267 family)